MLSRIASGVVVGVAILAGLGQASAADFSIADETVTPAVPEPPGGWNFRLTPYAWMASVNGTITARGRTVDTYTSFVDLLTESDQLVPFMGYFQAKRDRFTIFGDMFYSKVGMSNENTIQKNPIAGLTLKVKGESDLTTTMFISQLAGAYEVGRYEAGEGAATAFDVYAGARYWYMDADLSLKITGQVDLKNLGLKREGKFAVAKSGGTDWVDPLIGVGLTQQIVPGQEIAFRGDIGGFGVGSEFSWQVYTGYSHEFHIGDLTMAGVIGYRALAADYVSGSGKNKAQFDLILHGPVAGLSFRW